MVCKFIEWWQLENSTKIVIYYLKEKDFLKLVVSEHAREITKLDVVQINNLHFKKNAMRASALDSGLRGLCISVVLLGKTHCFTVPLYTQEYK